MTGRKFVTLLFFLFLVFTGCGPTQLIRSTITPDRLQNQDKQFNYIKIHSRDGGLYIFHEWKINPSGDTITGAGKWYNYKRDQLASYMVGYDGNPVYLPVSVPLKDITIVETNKLPNNIGNLAALSVVGLTFGITAIYCIINPKACFGSCPTFYAMEGENWKLMAEGFSSSIAPVFEKKDVDMLYWADNTREKTSLKLTNEALETHVIRYVDILGFPCIEGEKVFATENGAFYRTSEVMQASACYGEEGDCCELIREMDHRERFSLASSVDLAEKEEIIITFDQAAYPEAGLLIGSRQTLLTTFLFYQVMALTGHHYGSFIAQVENGNNFLRKRIERLWDKLGGIRIFMLDDGDRWQEIGQITEMGPIAPDVHLVKLPSDHPEKITLKLSMTRGLWRIDYLALARLAGRETPVRFQPVRVWKDDDIDHSALEKLTEGTAPLVTLPGDVYRLDYNLSTDCSYQYFLETQGYYLEWMREEWMKEENLRKAAFAFSFPGLFMKSTAPEFKKAEPEMEKTFWESRYVK